MRRAGNPFRVAADIYFGQKRARSPEIPDSAGPRPSMRPRRAPARHSKARARGRPAWARSCARGLLEAARSRGVNGNIAAARQETTGNLFPSKFCAQHLAIGHSKSKESHEHYWANSDEVVKAIEEYISKLGKHRSDHLNLSDLLARCRDM